MKIYCQMETGIGKFNIEDRVLIDNSVIAGGVYSAVISGDRPFVVAVADGVGGNNAGNVASHIAAEGLITLSMSQVSSEQALIAKISQINAKIVELSKLNAAYSKMATTLTGMLFTGERWFLFHVGNCRAYTWRSPYLNQLTKDHTWANEMRLLGMTEDEIESSGRSSEIISCLGNGDVSTAKRLCVTDVTGEITEASRIILTCDGIHDFMTNGELEQGINSMDNIPELLQLSMHFVRENGSQDDLSMLVIDMK